jgi:hypothetical protein
MGKLVYTQTKPIIKVKNKPGHKARQEEYQAWLKRLGLNPNTKKKTKEPFKVLTKQNVPYRREDGQENIPSITSTKPLPELTARKPQYNDEMLERELVAQEETEYKKTCTAPAYNKGPYVYVTPGYDPKTLGRKV